MTSQTFALLLLATAFSQAFSAPIKEAAEISSAGATNAAVTPFAVTGLCAAPFTPFTPDTLDLNLPVVDKQVQWLSGNGVSAAFVGGTTGESLSMTLAERKQLLEAWVVAGAKYGVTVIAHVGAEAQREAQDLARHAQETGAAAIGIMPPTFFKPASAELLAEFIAGIAEASPALPVYYYHIDCMTGVHVRMTDLLTAIEAHGGIPNFRGVKFTNYHLHDFMQCQREFGGRFDMLFGRDEMLLAALATGSKGFVGSTYNYMAKPYLDAIKAFESGDIATARERQYHAVQVIGTLGNPGGRYGPSGVNVGKAILELRGTPVGPPRPPMRPMTDSTTQCR